MKPQFFGENGLTATSANYICNLAKEAYEKLESKLNSTNFVEEYITVIGSMGETKVAKASKELLNEAPKMLEKIYNLKSLIAWLREAIKEKDNLFKENKKYVSDATNEFTLAYPQKEDYLTEQDIISSWTVKEQERYLSLETMCAVIGKYIHPNGPLSNAKKQLSRRINNPIVTENSGRDTIIRRYSAAASEEEVDTLFFELQKTHRDAQSELNGIKHKIEVALREDMRSKDEKFKQLLETYNSKLSELREADRLTRIAKDKEIESLKIVIPNNLKETYSYLTKLGK